MGSESSYAAQKWGLAGAEPDSERSDDEKTSQPKKPLGYRHVVPPHSSYSQKKPEKTEKPQKSEKA